MARFLVLVCALMSYGAAQECRPCSQNSSVCCMKGQLCPGQIACCAEANGGCGQDHCECSSTQPTTAPPTPSAPTPAPTGPQPTAPTPPTPYEPNPPVWPPSVRVFSPTDTDIQQVLNAAFAQNGGHEPPDHGQFSSGRYAFLFKPGSYSVDVPVGYYTSVHGLGEEPSQVEFTSAKGVYSEEGSYDFNIGALNSFWRGAENFKTHANFRWFGGGGDGTGMLWAVSQATFLRRVDIVHSLVLYQYTYGDAAGFASGGYLSNAHVAGAIYSGSQQQWFSRNCKVGSWVGGVWNMVFVGTHGAPASHCGRGASGFDNPYINVEHTPLVAEKPFITVDTNGKFWLQIPNAKENSIGPQHTLEDTTSVPFEEVFVARDTDSSATINAKLQAGRHVVLSAGIYQLTETLVLVKSNQVLLGLGYATLIPPANGEPSVKVNAGLEGVHIAGILLQAGTAPTKIMLQWGEPGEKKDGGNRQNPGFLHDVFARVGGPDNYEVRAEVMMAIYSDNVIGDNFWLWRADHYVGGLVRDSANPCTNALVVEGDSVIMYGLAVEHVLGDQVVWNGEDGHTYFFQCEYPYDVTQANFGDRGFVAYRVGAHVQNHSCHGAGVYHYFRDEAVVVGTGISCPAHLEGNFHSSLAVFLNGLGTLKNVLNLRGAETSPQAPTPNPGAHAVWVCPSNESKWQEYERKY